MAFFLVYLFNGHELNVVHRVVATVEVMYIRQRFATFGFVETDFRASVVESGVESCCCFADILFLTSATCNEVDNPR